MFDGLESTVLLMLGAVVFLFVLLIWMVLGIGRSLHRIERRLSQTAAEPAPKKGEVIPKGRPDPTSKGFVMFLEEDPERRMLPKREQFAAYRKWRNERGLNWPER